MGSYTCDVSNNCLKCPLARCKHDDLQGYFIWRRRDLDGPVETLTSQGWRASDIAQQLGKTERTVFRALKRVRNRTGEES